MDLFCLLSFILLIVMEMQTEVVSSSQQEQTLAKEVARDSACDLQVKTLASCAAENHVLRRQLDIALAQSQTQQEEDNSGNNDQPKLKVSMRLAREKLLSSTPSTDDNECTFDWDDRTCSPKCWCLFVSPDGSGCVRERGCFFTERKGIGHIDKAFVLLPPS